MKANNLSVKGELSMTKAQSISNLIYQSAREIERKFSGVNNSTKTITLNGESFIKDEGKALPENVLELLERKSALHAAQGFLMENVNAKALMLKLEQEKQFENTIEAPTLPKYHQYEALGFVDAEWGVSQLSANEFNEFLEKEAYASHIGQFIHKGGALDNLRNGLTKTNSLEWHQLRTNSAVTEIPVRVTYHHSPEQLLKLHTELANVHGEYEKRVNYFKAKVHNLVTDENTRISKVNQDEQARINSLNDPIRAEYNEALVKYQQAVKVAREAFNEAQFKEIKRISKLKISVDERFKTVIDEFMKVSAD